MQRRPRRPVIALPDSSLRLPAAGRRGSTNFRFSFFWLSCKPRFLRALSAFSEAVKAAAPVQMAPMVRPNFGSS